MTQRKT